MVSEPSIQAARSPAVIAARQRRAGSRSAAVRFADGELPRGSPPGARGRVRRCGAAGFVSPGEGNRVGELLLDEGAKGGELAGIYMNVMTEKYQNKTK